MKATKPKKDGMLNTWLIDIDGYLNYYGADKYRSVKRQFCVRFTSDLGKETLSITDENANTQYLVPFKKVQELIDIARANKNKGVS